MAYWTAFGCVLCSKTFVQFKTAHSVKSFCMVASWWKKYLVCKLEAGNLMMFNFFFLIIYVCCNPKGNEEFLSSLSL